MISVRQRVEHGIAEIRLGHVNCSSGRALAQIIRLIEREVGVPRNPASVITQAYQLAKAALDAGTRPTPAAAERDLMDDPNRRTATGTRRYTR